MSIRATVREGLGLVKVLERRDGSAALRQHFHARFGIALPEAPRRMTGSDVAVMGLGPGVWLASKEATGNDFAPVLKALLAGTASISDQSDAYVVLRLEGPGLREVLAKLVPIDLHERAFAPGDVAETLAAHIGVILWRLANDGADLPVFELAVSRSYAASLYHALSMAAPGSETVAGLAAAHRIEHVG